MFIRSYTTKLFFDNRKLWKAAQKVFQKESIILKEKGKASPYNKKLTETFTKGPSTHNFCHG